MSHFSHPDVADGIAHVFAYHADALTFLRELPNDWCHAIITDPPYGLADHKPERVIEALTAWSSGDRERVPTGRGFMGREWDAFVPPPAVWDECLRVLRPGGHLAVFAGSRTVDLMGLSIRLAGFEMRDGLAAWLYGSGFPKSLDVSKALDKAAGATREVVGSKLDRPGYHLSAHDSGGQAFGSGLSSSTVETRAKSAEITAPATDAAREWQGWGTALKPAHEPILLARKPLSGTVAANVLAHRAGAINVDACRVAYEEGGSLASNPSLRTHINGGNGGHIIATETERRVVTPNVSGRWPTNVVLAHHPDCGPDEAPGPCVPGCQVAALDEQSGIRRPGERPANREGIGYHDNDRNRSGTNGERVVLDSGGASRFFPTFRYQAKAPKTERPMVDGKGHPTVKPLGLMRWLVRLLVPVHDGQAGMVVDPFAGSGATLEAARLEGVRAVGIERDEHSARLIAKRLGVEFRESVAEEPVVAAAPDSLDVLLADAAEAGSLVELKALARGAVKAGLWTDDVRAVFTARRLEIEAGEAA